ncbi:unnamed protein product [Cylicostephanus goldi]|uniref:Uncharacterized protein n=1 Tax=Cylicostephanus goldi TaxID=71465 RepID=A0A3P6SDU9_CYLGO|nr:unnamed protein product [Cylicostephanus goldi]
MFQKILDPRLCPLRSSKISVQVPELFAWIGYH